jgi:predicted membrane protein
MKKSTHGEPLQFCKYTKGSFPVTILNMLICKFLCSVICLPILYPLTQCIKFLELVQKWLLFFSNGSCAAFLMIQFFEDHFTLLCVLIYIKKTQNT